MRYVLVSITHAFMYAFDSSFASQHKLKKIVQIPLSSAYFFTFYQQNRFFTHSNIMDK